MNIDNISKFTKFKDEDDDFIDTAKVLYKKKLSKPDWCFVAEKDNQVYGRVGYWSALDKKEVAHIFGFDLVLDQIKTLQIDKKLLQHSFQDMNDQGFKKIKAQTHSNDGDIYKVSNQFYQSIGMDKTQLKKRFQLNTNQYDQRKYNRLEYKSLKEIGKEKFMNVLEDVSNDSLDSSVAKRINKLGKGQAVEEHFNILKSIEYSKED
ncbi:MAG: hypothetical protein K9K32_01790 [Halanaerobiales bacterium]|nr:hypothetical protein [Halanaerobiales bacterium]